MSDLRHAGEHLAYDEADGYGRDEEVRVTASPAAGALGEVSPFGGPRHPEPCSLVIFGATGDLAHRKLMPALYDLGCHGVLPFATSIVGYGRQPLSAEAFRTRLRQAVDDYYGAAQVDGAVCERILTTPSYVQGEFDDPEGYRRLAAVLDELDRSGGARGNRMFYLATPPSQFPVIARQLGAAGLARHGAYDAAHAGGEPVAGWTRLVVEKPFGRDLATARELNAIIAGQFDERQVYRIDHYLAKETVQNLLVLRFANAIFEPLWTREFVDHVQITAAETLGVEHRGPYYEEAGALRDMVKPHLIQLFSLVAMEPPGGVRRRRRARREAQAAAGGAPDPRRPRRSVRGPRPVRPRRGGRGEAAAYRSEDRVAPDSHTETFAALKLLVDNWRWQGVPFYLRTGKRLARRVTEIAIQFKRPPVTMFRHVGLGGGLDANALVLRVQPHEGFSLRIESKAPGHGIAPRPVHMDYSYGGTLDELPFSAYETVLVDAMEGDMTLFKRGDQVERAWDIMQPVLDAWSARRRAGSPSTRPAPGAPRPPTR